MTVSIEGPTGGSRIEKSPKTFHCPSENLLRRITGDNNTDEIIVEGVKAQALVDTESMITTIALNFYNTLYPKPELKKLTDFNLEVNAQMVIQSLT